MIWLSSAGKTEKKKAAREEDARPDLEYGWEEEYRIRHRALGGGDELDECFSTELTLNEQYSLTHTSYANTLPLA